MSIKNMLKQSKNNDIFAKKIHSDNKEFDGRYFLFIRVILPYREDDDKCLIFRVKITKGKEIPSVEEMNQLEYIQFTVEDLDRAINQFQNWMNENNLSLYPDQYGYLYVYQAEFIPTNGRKYPEDLTYIGNYEFDVPEKEYIAYDTKFISLYLWDDVDIDLIECYNEHNKRDKSFYNDEIAAIRKKNYHINKAISEQVDRETKEIIAKYGEEQIDKWLENEPYTEDSLTYVGENLEEDEDYKLKITEDDLK